MLGSGWAAASLFKALPEGVKEKYEVIMVSPRNYFLYTPLLPAVCTGTMEERSIVEPVRNLVKAKGEYYEAVAKAVDPVRKELVACFPKDAGERRWLGSGARKCGALCLAWWWRWWCWGGRKATA